MVNRHAALPRSTEALIVGGGPAGLCTAIALRRKGIDCMVVEALSPCIDKACGEGLLPDALSSLRSLGVVITEHDGYPFCGIRFVDQDHAVEASFPHGVAIGVRRTHLHGRLVEEAANAGVHVFWRSRVQLSHRHAALINGQEVNFRWLVGADGQASSVRRWAGLNRVRKEQLRFGFRRHYQVAPWSDFVEVHWGPIGQMYVTPVGPQCVCLAFLSRDHRFLHDDTLAFFPEVAQRLGGAPLLSQQRGALSATRKLHRIVTESVALIGDASGSVDAITGEGMGLCFRQAHALAEAIGEGSLDSYCEAHASIGKLPHAMGSLMLTMDRRPRFAARAIRALAGDPSLFRELLSVHTGAQSVLRFAVQRGPQLGWGLLAGGMHA